MQRNLKGSTTGSLTMTENWVGFVAISTQILAHHIAKLQCPVVIPNSTFAHLQNQVGIHSDRGTQHSANSLIWILQTTRFAGLDLGSPVPTQGAESQSYLQWRISFCPICQSGWWKHLKAILSRDTWAEMQARRADCPQAKPGWGMAASCAMHRQED